MPLLTIPVVSDDEESDDEHEPPPRVLTHHAIPSAPHPQPTTTTSLSQVRSLTYEAMLHTHKLHDNVIQTTCSTQYSMTRLVS